MGNTQTKRKRRMAARNDDDDDNGGGGNGGGGVGTTSYPSEEVKKKVEGIQRNDPKLIGVLLFGGQLTDSHVKEIAIGLCSTHQGGYGNDKVKGLVLHDNNISDDGARALGYALGEGGNRALKMLDLRGNNISDEGARALGHALGEGGNATLGALRLGGNKIGDNGIRYLADALQVNNGLQGIHLGDKRDNSGNEITDKGAEYLYEALQENTRVTEILLDNNPIKDQALIGKIQELVQRNKKEPERAQREAAEHRKKREEDQQNEKKGSPFGNNYTGSGGNARRNEHSVPLITTASSSLQQRQQQIERERTRIYEPIRVMRLEEFAELGDIEGIRDLRKSLKSVDRVGNTVLHRLLKSGNTSNADMVARLLCLNDLKFDVDIQDNREKTILHLALEQSHFQVAHVILQQHSPNVDLVDENGMTARSHIRQHGEYDDELKRFL